MIAKLQNPIAAAGLSLVICVALGVGLCWRAAGPLLEAAMATHVKKTDEEKKAKGWDFWTIEIENLSNELKEERSRLRKQSELLDQRDARIKSEEKELGKIRAEIENMRKEIGDRVIEISADESKNIRALAQTYANLTPRAAVAILKEMDDTTAVKILSLMKADIVGQIFEQMSVTPGTDGTPLARRAAVLSEKLRLMKSTKTAAQP